MELIPTNETTINAIMGFQYVKKLIAAETLPDFIENEDGKLVPNLQKLAPIPNLEAKLLGIAKKQQEELELLAAKYQMDTLAELKNIQKDLTNTLQSRLGEVEFSRNIKTMKARLKKELNIKDKVKSISTDFKNKQVQMFKDEYQKQKEKVKEIFKKEMDDAKAEVKSKINQLKNTKQLYRNLLTQGGILYNDYYIAIRDTNQAFSNLVEDVKSIAVETSSALAKVPQPGAVGPVGPNPGYALVSFMQELKIITSLLMDIYAQIQTIKDGLEKLFGGLQYLTTQLFRDELNKFKPIVETLGLQCEMQLNQCKKQAEDCFDSFKRDGKAIIETTKAPVYYNADPLKDMIAYYSPIVNFIGNEMELKGFNFYYCTSSTTGRNIVYPTMYTQQIRGKLPKNYDINKFDKQWWFFRSTSDINDHEIDAKDPQRTTVTALPKTHSLETGTLLELNDGRKVVIDKQVSSGDIIKLIDGTIVKIA